MQYWIICLPREDIVHCMSIGRFGRNQKWIMGRVRKGDKLACIASRDWKIIGLGEITSEYYLDDSPCFLKEGLFPDRFDFEADILDKELDLIQVLDKLTFIKNLAYWAVHFRNGIVQISESDWTLISTQ